jgi:recombination protein RecA
VANKNGVSIEEMRKLINKKAGVVVAHNLKDENPTEVIEWIPTGSRWLDSIICRGQVAGIPVGKVTEIAGLEATGKSYMAAKIAANAQKMGITVIYFDSESAIDPAFLENAGCNVEDLIYIQAQSVEMLLESIEEFLKTGEKFLFIWDSLALTPAIGDVEGDFNPLSSMALKARILAKAMSKITIPIANSKSTFLVLNQLKTNITRNPNMALVEPYVTPGGKAMIYAYSLRVWLTGRKSKASFITDDNGFRIGSEVKATLKKSRFGSQGRQATFKILWGDEVRILDEESWLEAIKASEYITIKGSWYSLDMGDGEVVRFQPGRWMEKIKDPAFKSRVLEVMEEHVIQNFKTRQGNPNDFYDVDGDEDQDQPALKTPT